ncbi:EpsI family protein [Isosphaera pallida ATCC 43644]|uniref:EpsI family protein n=2 Tax=Isosphaera pallida TaxID=128 RepID=E8R398_ISOPI|nr:EpsI family protein [Isosphaera pallida ATCC 43644]
MTTTHLDSASVSASPSDPRTRPTSPRGSESSPPSTLGIRHRAILGMAMLAIGLGGEQALEAMVATERPPLKASLSELPMTLGTWVGRDAPMAPEVIEQSQCTEYVSRRYEDSRRPGRVVQLWINYSEFGLNMRHSPEICLPSSGWSRDDSRCRVEQVRDPGSPEGRLTISLLAYAKNETRQTVGFWYYIFGEGWWEEYVRGLPITSRSSHGRTTRGSGMTVEVFADRDADSDGTAVHDFAEALLPELERFLPDSRAAYFRP